MVVVESVILISELQTNSLGQLPVNLVYWTLCPEDSHFRNVFTFHTLFIKEKSHAQITSFVDYCNQSHLQIRHKTLLIIDDKDKIFDTE